MHLDGELIDRFDESEILELETLYKAILSLKDMNELHKFFVDLCSTNEICSFLRRWQILLRIQNGCSYESIIEDLSHRDVRECDGKQKRSRNELRVSSATISRVNSCYKRQDSGYRLALERLRDNNEL